MAEDALFNLRWDAQRSALLGSMASLYREEAFVDTSIVADHKIFKAHKLLLSASSSYMKQMLESVPVTQHAVIFMPHISAQDLGNLLKFIYDGEIKINKRSLKSFLSLAKLLRIKGMDFELNEDLESNFPPAYAQNLSNSSATSPINPHKRFKEARFDEDVNASVNTPSTNNSSQIRNDARSTPPKENGQSYNSSAAALNNNSATSSDEETKVSRPAPISRPISGSGRSTDSVSSQVSNNALSPNGSGEPSKPKSNGSTNNNITINGDDASQSSSVINRVYDDGTQDDSNASDNGDKNTALNLHIGRFHDNESVDMDQDSRTPRNDRDDHGPLSIVENDMDDEYDDDDDDGSFSMSIQPEVSLRESDESYNINERRHSYPFKPTNFSNSLNLSLLGNSAMSITQAPGGVNNNSMSSSSPLSLQQQLTFSLQQQLTLKHLSKLARPPIPKAHQMSGQGSPPSGNIASINEGILMRMMKEPLQGGTASPKSINSPSNHGGFFDHHNDPNLHSAGLRKQKRYVQCTSCSKVLSSLSALKRHMEDVHCSRIHGKCLLCGRVYSSRNSLLTHVYSAHKKHHDYKAVARIIRESDFEQFATA